MQLKTLGLQGATSIDLVRAATAKMKTEDLAATLAKTGLTAEQQASILVSRGVAKEEAASAVATATHSAANVTATATTGVFTGATVSLKTALKGLWATLMSNPIMWVVVAATVLITVFNSIKQSQEEAAQAAEENYNALKEQASAANDTKKSLDGLIKKYKDLKDSYKGAWSAEEATELESIQSSIAELVGAQASNLDLVNGKVEEEYQKLLKIYNLVSDDAYESAESLYSVSKQKLEKGYERETDFWGNSKESDQRASWYIRRAYEELSGVSNIGDNGSSKWWGQQAGLDMQWIGDIPEALEQIGSYQDGLEKLKEWRDMVLDAGELDDSNSEAFFGYGGEVYNTADALAYLNSKIEEFEGVISEADVAKENFFKAKADNETLDYLVKNNIDTQRQFEDYVNSIYNNEDISKDYAEVLINTMHSYLPAFEIPDNIKRAFITDRDELVKSITDSIPEADESVIGNWLNSLGLSEYKSFVDWWNKNSKSDVVTASSSDMIASFDAYLKRIQIASEGLGQKTYDTIKTNVDTLISNIDAAKKAISSQKSGESLSLKDFNSTELKEYTSALEYNNGVLQLNKDKVNEIIDAKTNEQIAINNSAKALEQQKYLKNAAEIEKLRQKIKDNNYAEGESKVSIQNNIAALLEENSAIKSNCDSYGLMTSALEQTTDAYHNWLNAQSATQTGEIFDEALNAINHINDTLNNSDSDLFGRIGNEDFKAALEFVIPESVDKEDTDKVNSYLKSIYGLFAYNEDGKYSGLNITNFCKRAVDEGLMILDESGESYQIAGSKTMEDFAEGLNLSLPLVQAMFGEMEEFGGEFSWADEANKTIGDLGVSANVAAEKLRALNKDIVINLDVGGLKTTEEKTDALNSTIKQMQKLKVKPGVDSSEIEYANSIISYCVTQMQQLENPAILDIDASKVNEVSKSAGEAVSLLQEFKTAYNNLDLQKSLGLDTTDAQAKVDSLFSKISSSDNDYIISLGLDSSSVANLNKSISDLGIEEIKAKFSIDDTALKSYTPEDKKATVTYNVDSSNVERYNPKNLSRTVTYYTRTVGSVGGTHRLNGTAHANGTALAGGDWGTAPGGRTLVGELGRKYFATVYRNIYVKFYLIAGKP